MNWSKTKSEVKNQIMSDKPIAKVDDDGNISLEVSNTFYETLDAFCDAGKAEVKKSAFQVAMLSALGIAGAAVAVTANPGSMHDVLIAARAFTLGGGFYVLNAFRKKAEAQRYYDHLEESFLNEAEERYQNKQYYAIGDDGVIEFDQPATNTQNFENPEHIEDTASQILQAPSVKK